MNDARSTRTPLPWALAAFLALAGCGGTSTSSIDGFVIRIQGLQFQPAALEVPPGATVFVLNEDGSEGIPHSVTSEAAAGAYAFGTVAGVGFDTGVFTSSVGAFTIPATAPEGTVVPFYCQVYRALMSPPDGAITVRAGATPNGT